jgi:hypothetical protein
LTGWRVEPDYARGEVGRAFASLDAVFALEGEPIASDQLSRVRRVTVAGRRFYVKCYHGAGKKPLRAWFGRQRVQAEWENLRAFRDWGIPTAPLVAYGLERRRGGFARGALVTAEIEHTRDLAQLAREHDARLADRRWVARVSHQLARATRAMHTHGFAHNDLKWRNLLVSDGDAPTLYFIDCPNGAFWWGPFLRYRIVKDLACLDKVAKYQLSRTRRLRFYLDYAGRRRLDADDKQRIREIVDFFAGRE